MRKLIITCFCLLVLSGSAQKFVWTADSLYIRPDISREIDSAGYDQAIIRFVPIIEAVLNQMALSSDKPINIVFVSRVFNNPGTMGICQPIIDSVNKTFYLEMSVPMLMIKFRVYRYLYSDWPEFMKRDLNHAFNSTLFDVASRQNILDSAFVAQSKYSFANQWPPNYFNEYLFSRQPKDVKSLYLLVGDFMGSFVRPEDKVEPQDNNAKEKRKKEKKKK